MELHYKKNNNKDLFTDLEKKELLNVEKVQNFVPLYLNYFSLNETNYNNINLNQKYNLVSINKKVSENKFIANINHNDKIQEKEVFFKLSPLYDPIKYMIGKYNDVDDFLSLPGINNTNGYDKLHDKNNASYVDSFFSYLTSQMLNHHNFVHGVDFYGSLLAIKNDYKINVEDDIEYLQDSSFFKKNNNVENKGITFSIENDYICDLLFSGSRENKNKLKVSDEDTVLNLSDITDLSEFDTIFKTSKETGDATPDILFERNNLNEDSINSCSSNKSNCTDKSSDTCSSRSSNTSNEEDGDSDDGSDNGSENSDDEGSMSDENSFSDSESECSSSASENSTATEDQVIINVSKFPIQIICLEQCDKTLDSLLSKSSLSEEEWGSLIMQVLMTLITYQKVFDLTHNDLHTNNIMYNETNKKYLEYCYNGTYYNIPTFGRIYKIIDFGRAIYTYKGKQMCSDSFHPAGDAATQYNFKPFYNEKKKEILPNLSFDLCRLGCSLFDFIVDELEDNDEIKDLNDLKNITSPIKKIILEWCNDDKGRNVIYKKNGEERYPEFKLYKMIVRTVHKHVPCEVLKHSYFKKYVVHKVKRKQSVIDIDSIPSMQ